MLRLMLQDPSNLDVAFEYAALSSQVGDYEAAVSTLERMLIFAPNTPRLELELGILYYRLGSYEVSRSYFAQVVANPNVPPEIAAKVRLYLQQLAIEAQPPPFSATIFSGIRWESNANSAPASQAVTLNGIDFTLDTQSVAAPDWSAVNIGTMHYGYDLKNQGDRIEFDAITYNADYFHLTDIDLNFFEATLGPSFNMKRIGWDKTRFYVYGIGDEVLQRCNISQGQVGHAHQFQQRDGPQYTDNIHLGWWVAGDVIDQSDLPTDMTASYEGHAIGNVATNIGGNGWVTYVATGDMYMDWDFNARSGNLSIYHFDRSITPGGLTFGGTMTTPGELTGKNTFGGPLSLSGDLPNNLNELNGMTGSATGSFVRGPSNFNNDGRPVSGSTPQGVIGNWNVGSERYSATGIFAGSVNSK